MQLGEVEDDWLLVLSITCLLVYVRTLKLVRRHKVSALFR